MNNTTTSTVSPGGRAGLQLLRLAAICLLVGYHAALIAPYEPSIVERIARRVANAGWIGTDLFLALAGFLAFDSRQRSTGQLRWLARRAIRVLPSYWAFLVIYLHVVPWLISLLGGRTQDSYNYGSLDQALANQPYLCSLTTNLRFASGTWIGAALEPLLTIAIGAQLVLIAAAILPLRRGAGFLVALGGLECIGVILRFLWRNDQAWLNYSFPLTRCDAFLFGMMAAWILHREAWHERLVKATPKIALVGLILGSLAFVTTKGLDVESKLSTQLGYPLIGLCFACVVLATSQAGIAMSSAHLQPPPLPVAPPYARFLTWLSKAGAVTFGAYLVKLPLMGLINHLLPKYGITPTVLSLIVLGTAASFIGGWLWFRLVETSLSRVFSRLTGRAT